MVKILVVGKYYPPGRGGTEANTMDICEALAVRHEVTALVFNHEPGHRTEILNGVRIFRCHVDKIVKSQPISARYWLLLQLRDVDLVHLQAPNFLGSAALLLQLWFTGRDIPVVISHQSDVLGRRLLRALAMPLYRRLARKARCVIVTSLKNARVSADIPFDAKLAVVPLGIDPRQFAIDGGLRADAMEWRRGLCGDAPTVAFIGRHVRYKGLDVLVRAIAMIPRAHALIAGDGPVKAMVQDLAIQLGLKDRIHFFGEVNETEKLRLLAASDVFAFPSTEITEAFGISQLEAMAAGVAVVASDIPTGVTDVAIHEKTALLVRPNDAGQLASAITRLLKDETLRAQLIANAHTRIASEFSKDVSMKRFCSLIDDVLKLTVFERMDLIASPI